MSVFRAERKPCRSVLLSIFMIFATSGWYKHVQGSWSAGHITLWGIQACKEITTLCGAAIFSPSYFQLFFHSKNNNKTRKPWPWLAHTVGCTFLKAGNIFWGYVTLVYTQEESRAEHTHTHTQMHEMYICVNIMRCVCASYQSSIISKRQWRPLMT